MSIISFGIIEKKLFLVVFIIIIRILQVILWNKLPPDYTNASLYLIEEEIGPIIAAIIINYKFKNIQKKINTTKKHFKYIIYLFIFRAVQIGYYFLKIYIINDNQYNYDIILNSTNGIEIILISIATFLTLKYKYYIHHIISMIIYCILGISIDLILNNFFLLNYKYIGLFAISIINELFLFCYIKYMLDKLYYQLVEIIFYFGIIGIIIIFCLFSSLIIYQYENEIDGISNSIKIYFNNTNVTIIIFYQFLFFILTSGFYCSLIILLLYYLKPNHKIIVDQIEVYTLILMAKNPNKWYTVIPFVLQILVLLFYFEILEFNLWNLNRNTIKNILIRELTENQNEEERSFSQIRVGFGEQYYIINDELKNNNNYTRESIETEKCISLNED